MRKRLSLIIFIMMLVVSIVSIDSVFAKGEDFSLTKAQVGEKSETVTVNKFSYKASSVINDVTFHKVGDYVTYKLVLKNTSGDTLTIKSITDNNGDKNVTYSYDKSKGVKIKKGNTLTLLVKAKYAKAETDTSKREKKLSTTFTINYIDSNGKSGSSSININPGTSDKIMLFTGLLLGSLVIMLVILIDKKKKISKKKLATFVMVLSLVLPIGVSAVSGYSISFNSIYNVMDKLVITLDINGKKVKKVIDYNTVLSGIEDPEKDGYVFAGWVTSDGKDFDISKPITGDVSIEAKFEEKIAYLQTGKNILVKLLKLGGATNPYWAQEDDLYYNSNEVNLKKIKYATESQYNSVKDTLTSENNIISDSTSDIEVYAWSDGNGTIYYYSDSDKIYMNEDASFMFALLYDVTEIDLSHFDTSKVKNLGWLFEYDYDLLSLDLSTFDTSNVTNMKYMFYCNYSLSSVDISSFDTSKVTDMSQMFASASGLQSLDVSSFDTANVTDMSGMFQDLKSLSNLDVSGFNTSKVTDMSQMFASDSMIQALDVSHWDTSKVTDMVEMFGGCATLTTLNFSNFDTSHVTDMERMFRDCGNLTSLDLSSFDTSAINSNTNNMFANCMSLSTIYVSNKFVITSYITNASDMFVSCPNLRGGAGTVFNSSHTSGEYARIDDPDNGRPGYFTAK